MQRWCSKCAKGSGSEEGFGGRISFALLRCSTRSGFHTGGNENVGDSYNFDEDLALPILLGLLSMDKQLDFQEGDPSATSTPVADDDLPKLLSFASAMGPQPSASLSFLTLAMYMRMGSAVEKVKLGPHTVYRLVDKSRHLFRALLQLIEDNLAQGLVYSNLKADHIYAKTEGACIVSPLVPANESTFEKQMSDLKVIFEDLCGGGDTVPKDFSHLMAFLSSIHSWRLYKNFILNHPSLLSAPKIDGLVASMRNACCVDHNLRNQLQNASKNFLTVRQDQAWKLYAREVLNSLPKKYEERFLEVLDGALATTYSSALGILYYMRDLFVHATRGRDGLNVFEVEKCIHLLFPAYLSQLASVDLSGRRFGELFA